MFNYNREKGIRGNNKYAKAHRECLLCKRTSKEAPNNLLPHNNLSFIPHYLLINKDICHNYKKTTVIWLINQGG